MISASELKKLMDDRSRDDDVTQYLVRRAVAGFGHANIRTTDSTFINKLINLGYRVTYIDDDVLLVEWNYD